MLLSEFAFNEDSVDDLEQDLEQPHSYDAIDHMMQTIARKYKITPEELHDKFMAKHGVSPDDWIKDQLNESNLTNSKIKLIQHWLNVTNIGSVLSVNDINDLVNASLKHSGIIDVNEFGVNGAELIPGPERWGAYYEFVEEFEELATSLNSISAEQLDELSFMGSPCTKDCSGHRAGYDWSKRKGKIHAASWSRSFNNGAAIAAAEP